MNMRCVLVSACAGLLMASGSLAQLKPDPKPIGDQMKDSGRKVVESTLKGVLQPVNEATLIPRDVLFGNPEKSQLRLSPDGKMMAFIAPVNGVLNVWVAPIGELDKARAITSDAKRGIRQYFWAYDNTHVLYLQDVGGDENWKVFAVDTTKPGSAARDLTPFEDIKLPDGSIMKDPSGKPTRPAARINEVSEKFPGSIILALNNRNPQFHDLYSCDLASGQLTLLYQNDKFAGVELDDEYNIRFASAFNSDGGIDSMVATEVKPGEGGTGMQVIWAPYETIPQEDSLTSGALGFDKSNQKIYMRDSRGRDTGALYLVDAKTKAKTLIAENPKADVGGVIVHPTEKNVQAVSFNYLRNEWTVLDKSIQADLDYLKTVSDGEVNITSRTLDDRKWVVAYAIDNGPAKSYIYDRDAKKATFVFVNNQRLAGLPLTHMQPVVIKSRDGLDLVAYLSLPLNADANQDGKPEAPVPMVLDVHGGPWARDAWGYNPEHQWLTNRGYAVLSVNFRGSTGFGKNFVNAGNREWAGKMHNDLLDAVDWAVKQNVTTKDKVAIYGGSYGGYATLVGLTFTPDVFACGVDIVGPSNINTLLATIPAYWKPIISQFTARVGDFQSDEGKAFLLSRSPISKVDQIKKPLLIGQGANDPRVKQSEADQIVKAMQDKKIPVTYVLFADEGHGFARPPNRMAFYAVAEAFLAQHLGGRFQPVGSDFENSTIAAPAGADQIPGLSDALKR
ncbi:MAG: S9 family peptidase [Phycisphaerales bacterium]